MWVASTGVVVIWFDTACQGRCPLLCIGCCWFIGLVCLVDAFVDVVGALQERSEAKTL